MSATSSHLRDAGRALGRAAQAMMGASVGLNRDDFHPATAPLIAVAGELQAAHAAIAAALACCPPLRARMEIPDATS